MRQNYADRYAQISEWITSRFIALVEVIHSPESAFSRPLTGPSYLVPLVVLGLLSGLLSILQLPIHLTWAEQQMLASGAPGDQIASNLQWMKKSGQFGAFMVPLFLVLRWTLFACLLWLTVQLIANLIDFQRVLTVVAYSSVAILLREVFIYLILSLRDNDLLRGRNGLDVALGLNLIFPTIPLPWSVMAGHVNIFEVWYVFLLSIGLSRITASSWRRGILIVLPNWLFVVFVQVGIVSLGQTFQSRFVK